MVQRAEQTENQVVGLLREWGDALIRHQLHMPGAPTLDGGILCPCCKMIHGRCHEAVYPLLFLAARTGDDAYLSAAKRLFRWGGNLRCADGSFKNDEKSDWRGVTVFAAVALHDALYFHGTLLSAVERAAWEERLRGMGEWLFRSLRPGGVTAYLNYYAANACAMALLGSYFRNEDYLRLSHTLLEFCLSHVSPDGLLYGEGRPLDVRSEKGCFAIDAGGYNVEETLPALTRAAEWLKDAQALDRCRALWKAHLLWMLPDGAWDNSAGTRAFKWTYWGSRTADGCQDALFRLGRTDPVFAEAALRNLEVYRRCTQNGLLYGGPDYARHGELPCIHHTFCRSKTLAAMLDAGLCDFPRVPLPADDPAPLTYEPALAVYRLARGDWRADISAYDYVLSPGGHVSGGGLSLLWHKKTGPLVACGAVDFTLRELFNQQLPRDPATHGCVCPRVEATLDGRRFSQLYDRKAEMTACVSDDSVSVRVCAVLCSDTGERMDGGECALFYELRTDSLRIDGRLSPALLRSARFYMPLIGAAAGVTVLRGRTDGPPRAVFNLNPGFITAETMVLPDAEGVFSLRISV